jgi:sugar phosphate permease
MDAVEARTIAKVSKRLVPFLIVCYFVAYLDRVNVSFAALTMNQDLGLSQTAFGFGAGERRFHAAFPLFVAAAGIAVSTAFDDPTLKMLSLCVAVFGIFACLPVLWTLPTAFLSGAACAAGVADDEATQRAPVAAE